VHRSEDASCRPSSSALRRAPDHSHPTVLAIAAKPGGGATPPAGLRRTSQGWRDRRGTCGGAGFRLLPQTRAPARSLQPGPGISQPGRIPIALHWSTSPLPGASVPRERRRRRRLGQPRRPVTGIQSRYATRFYFNFVFFMCKSPGASFLAVCVSAVADTCQAARTPRHDRVSCEGRCPRRAAPRGTLNPIRVAACGGSP